LNIGHFFHKRFNKLKTNILRLFKHALDSDETLLMNRVLSNAFIIFKPQVNETTKIELFLSTNTQHLNKN
jgi:hypothetical protein